MSDDKSVESGWYENFESKILQDIEDCKGRDLRFFRVEEYLRNAERIDKLSSSCKTCKALKDRIDGSEAYIKQAVNKPGAERKKLDNIQQDIIEHMKKEHGYYPPQYHRYMQSIYWLLGCMAIAAVLARIYTNLPGAAFYSPAFIIGVSIGQIRGGMKDRVVEKEGKQL